MWFACWGVTLPFRAIVSVQVLSGGGLPSFDVTGGVGVRLSVPGRRLAWAVASGIYMPRHAAWHPCRQKHNGGGLVCVPFFPTHVVLYTTDHAVCLCPKRHDDHASMTFDCGWGAQPERWLVQPDSIDEHHAHSCSKLAITHGQIWTGLDIPWTFRHIGNSLTVSHSAWSKPRYVCAMRGVITTDARVFLAVWSQAPMASSYDRQSRKKTRRLKSELGPNRGPAQRAVKNKQHSLTHCLNEKERVHPSTLLRALTPHRILSLHEQLRRVGLPNARAHSDTLIARNDSSLDTHH